MQHWKFFLLPIKWSWPSTKILFSEFLARFNKIQHFITVYNFYHPYPEIEKKWKLIANIANIIDEILSRRRKAVSHTLKFPDPGFVAPWCSSVPFLVPKIYGKTQTIISYMILTLSPPTLFKINNKISK